MASTLQELGHFVVQDMLGDLCAEVFSILSTNGRSTRARIQQISGLPGRQLKITLACMTQLHILLHQTTDDEQTFYQIDWRSTYALIRSSRIIALAEERYGESAGKITAYLLQLGHARIQDLAEVLDLPAGPSKHENASESRNDFASGLGQNKDSRSRISTLGQLHSVVREMLRAGFLVKIGKQSYVPAADLQAEIEEIVISENFPDRKIGGPKKQREFSNAVRSLKRRRRIAEEFTESRDVQSSGVNGRGPKRSRLNNGLGHISEGGREEDGSKLSDDLILRVNHAQCVFALRSQYLQELAATKLGSTTAAVYGALLLVLETKLKARDEPEPPVDESDEEEDLTEISTVEVADVLDTSINLSTFPNADETRKTINGTGKTKKKKLPSAEDAENSAILGIKEEPSDSEDESGINGFHSHRDRGTRLDLIEEHLKLLDEHQLGFCKRVGAAARGVWKVDIASLTDSLIQKTIDATIMSRLGPIHMRVVRMLRDKGRVDEKQIASASMMRLKDVRSFLTQLQYAGFVESQDVPKDTQRQPSRTIYLYFYDQARVQEQLLQRAYKSLTRILQRLQLERQRYASAIEKAEKMDINQESLNQNEREAVMQWRAVEEKLLLQVDRLDAQVALMRDFSGRNTSLIS